MRPKPLPFTLRMSVGESIDTDKGLLQGVTVAEVGEATGHFVCLDKAGIVIGADVDDLPGTVRKIPLFMDEKGIDLVIAAGEAAVRAKAREDHDDSIGARAGYVSTFRKQDGKAVCDLNLLDAYRNRALFLETATKTPELIGLSGDFSFTADIVGDRAFMRVQSLDAIDIVDEGALTHAGLFSVRGKSPLAPNAKRQSVDNANGGKSPTNAPMANAPKIPAAGARPNKDSEEEIDQPEAPDMDAFKAMCEQVAAYNAHIKGNNTDFASKMADCMSAIEPVNTPTPEGAPAPVHGKPGNPDASVKDPNAAFAAMEARLNARVDRIQGSIGTELKKQFAALGIVPAAAPKPSGEDPAKPTPGADEPKTFLELKAKIKKDRNLAPGDAAKAAMAENPELYREYLKMRGIYDPAKDPRNWAGANR